jgi:hypothetical protein
VAGGRVAVAPFEIQVGRCVVVEDPYSMRLVLPDGSKESLLTGAADTIIALAPRRSMTACDILWAIMVT